MRAERSITAERSIETAEAERLFAIGEPSLKNLSHILRHRELWPKGQGWDYSNCVDCAMGLAHALWNEVIEYPGSHAMAGAFGMPQSVACRIFGGNEPLKTYGTAYYHNITPEMVAEKIDEYLAGVK